jgi:hypothetical protein
MSWLKIFFKNVLGFTDGLNCQFLIAHRLGAPMQLNRSFNSEPANLFAPSEPDHRPRPGRAAGLAHAMAVIDRHLNSPQIQTHQRAC